MKSPALFRQFYTVLLLVFLARTTVGIAQNSNSPPAGNAASPVSVQFMWPHDGDTFQSPTNIEISAWITPGVTFQPGDLVKVELFAGTRSLGTRTSTWHGEERPHAKHPRDALPMWIKPPQFDSAQWVWKKPPPGKYALTLKATHLSAPVAVSKPMNINIVAPISAPGTCGLGQNQ